MHVYFYNVLKDTCVVPLYILNIGGSGRRKLSIIPTDNEGYSTRLLKSVSNNCKNIAFVVPLQEQLSTVALPFDSPEFAKMPQSCCISCGSEMPLQMLPLHVEGCDGKVTVRRTGQFNHFIL